MGIEPTAQPWEGRILPLYYARTVSAEAIAKAEQKGSPFMESLF